MIIKAYQRDDRQRLFAYWTRMGRKIPYVFSVSPERWEICLLEDTLDGQPMFKHLETYVATDSGHVVGFGQWGQPTMAWDERGERCEHPRIGIIRHLAFDEGRGDVGEALLARAGGFLSRFRCNYAFYHMFGMSCNAYHGKLHNSLSRVERSLRSHGFEVEHENAYYVLHMDGAAPREAPGLHICPVDGSREERFVLRWEAQTVGRAHVRYLDRLTDGRTQDVVYLSWIGLDAPYRGQRLGAGFLCLLVRRLVGQGYHLLHTDTPSGNQGARRFYERLGFRQAGTTRSYVTVARQERMDL